MNTITRKIPAAVFLIILCILSFSCKKENDGLDITGNWHLVSSGELSMETVDVYVSFGEGAFSLYQKIGEGSYYRYEGTYTLTGNVLGGSYSDGTLWGSDYDITLEQDRLTMTARNGSGEVSVYTRKDIPAEVLENVRVKSSLDEAPAHFL